MILPVANPGLGLRGGRMGVGLALLAFLPVAIFPFFTQNKGGGPSAPPLDLPLTTIISGD